MKLVLKDNTEYALKNGCEYSFTMQIEKSEIMDVLDKLIDDNLSVFTLTDDSDIDFGTYFNKSVDSFSYTDGEVTFNLASVDVVAQRLGTLENLLGVVSVGKVPTLDEAKKSKVSESSLKLNEFLLANPVEYKGNYYTCTMEKQTELSLQYMSYQLEKQVNPDAKLTWNTMGDTCKEISEEDFVTLMLAIKTYVYPIVEQQRILEKQIMGCETVDDVLRVQIEYTTEPTDKLVDEPETTEMSEE